MQDSDKQEPEGPRRSGRFTRRHDKVPWYNRGIFSLVVDLALLAAIAGGIVLLLNPFSRWVEPPRVGFGLTVAQVLAYRRGALMLGLPLLFFSLLGLFMRVRWRITRSPRLREHRCPACGSDDLRRTHRRWYNRLMKLMGIPTAHYICADCRWRGTRIDKDRL
jgi:predicted RNA-binding Zn-ribbon protein involved in translation (DUF1610 family)